MNAADPRSGSGKNPKGLSIVGPFLSIVTPATTSVSRRFARSNEHHPANSEDH
jgi:hypothetical protein